MTKTIDSTEVPVRSKARQAQSVALGSRERLSRLALDEARSADLVKLAERTHASTVAADRWGHVVAMIDSEHYEGTATEALALVVDQSVEEIANVGSAWTDRNLKGLQEFLYEARLTLKAWG